MTVQASTPIELVEDAHVRLAQGVKAGRELLQRPLTLAEKILFGHLKDPTNRELERGASYRDFHPDRVAMQDATAQMAWLQFMTAGLPEVAVPTTTHCDHLILAKVDAKQDLLTAQADNQEVYTFLESVCARYGAGFWRPGSGIIHQVVLENYAFPGGMMIGTDSHTPNAGGLAMIAVGVGGADAVDVMTGFPWNVRWPKLIGVHLTGRLSGWSSPKDVILKVAELLTVKGGTGAIIEYFGEGATSLSCTGKATICNMGAEIGATTSIFGYDTAMHRYLRATGREAIAAASDEISDLLRPDDEVAENPSDYFDHVVEINLSKLEPHINGPHTPDRARPVSELAAEAAEHNWPAQPSAALVGSCTNSSYEDITRAASVLRDATARGIKVRTPLLVTPGSEQVRATIERDGLLQVFEEAGATVLANACGPCIGQWSRDDIAEGIENVIITSYNRNFPKRNDGSAATLAFVTSPETVVALALAGSLSFDPDSGTITTPDGTTAQLLEPVGEELPQAGFDPGESGFVSPPPGGEDGSGNLIEVKIDTNSNRLQALEPFKPWSGEDFTELVVLLKASGKCTTDHISMAGPWLSYRGHLENISDNLFLGATNAFSDETGRGKDQLDGQTKPFPEIAKHYHQTNTAWVAVGDENYGEGSSREHAAMEPRFRGCLAVIVRSFARIHETNLKKQGVLPLTFADPADYENITEDDRISILGLAELAPGQPVHCEIAKPDGSKIGFECNHTLSHDQIRWFKAGSALNYMRQQLGSQN